MFMGMGGSLSIVLFAYFIINVYFLNNQQNSDAEVRIKQHLLRHSVGEEASPVMHCVSPTAWLQMRGTEAEAREKQQKLVNVSHAPRTQRL